MATAARCGVLACCCGLLLAQGNAWAVGGARTLSMSAAAHLQSQQTRRVALRTLATCVPAAAAVVLVPGAACADAEPVPTAKLYLDVAIGDEKPRRLVIGVFGKEAPQAAANFVSVATSDFRGDISYDGSTVTRVDAERRVDLGKLPLGLDKYEVRRIDSTGRVRRQMRQAAEDLLSNDSNSLRHDRPGRVSIVKGGGTFEFTIAPAANPALDDTNTVFGQVVNGLDVLAAICAVPVTKEDILGTKQAFAGAGKGFDPRARIASIQKPLVKIAVVHAGLL